MSTIIFDLDDTLYHELDFVYAGFEAVARFLASKHDISFERLFSSIISTLENDGRGAVFNSICREFSLDEDIPMLVELYRNVKPDLQLYPEAVTLLEELKASDHFVGLITDGMSSVQWNKINGLNVKHYIDEIIVTDDLGRDYWKPSPRAFELMKNKCGLEFSQMVYIGDNPAKDFVSPNRLGMRSIRIIHESGDHINAEAPDNEHRAQAVVRSFAKLELQLKNWELL